MARGASYQSPSKRFEVWVRGLFNRRFQANSHPIHVDLPQDVVALYHDPDGRGLKILLLRQDRIGDVIVATPIISALRERYPHARIDVVLSRNNIAVEHAVANDVNTIHIYEKSLISARRLWKRLQAERYHVVVDLLDNASSTSSMLMYASRAPIRIGIDKENAGVYSHVVPLLDQSTVPINVRIAQLLLPFGIDPSQCDLRPRYSVTAHEKETARRLLGVNPDQHSLGVVLSGSLAFKRYDVEQMIEVLKAFKLRHPKVAVVVFGSPAEEDEVQRVAEGTGSVAAPASRSFHAYACQLSVMSALLTPDTAAVHLAAAWNTPCVVLYVPDVHGRLPWYPWQTPCEPLMSPTDHVRDITPTTVVDALQRLFAYCGLI